jgi:OmpA-OmpF porin, OOP family
MKKLRVLIAMAMLAAAWNQASAQTIPTVPGNDHPVVGRYEGSRLIGYLQKPFEARAFVIGGTADRSLVPADAQTIEGKSTLLAYDTKPGLSALEVFRNFQASLKAKGLTEAYICENNEGQPKRCPDPKQIAYRVVPFGGTVVEGGQCFKNSRYALYRKGSELTVALYVSDCFGANVAPRVLVSVLEAAAMATDQIVIPSPADMTKAFGAEGKIALYGVYFDTGRAEVKADSKPTLDNIAALLNAEPKLAVIITGYTDNVGSFESNLLLSKQRAESVVAALVTNYKIPAARLTAFGAGMTGPRAPNIDEAGRSKNRRVELSPR